ncbi:fibrillarin-like rRNA/tRNA 2'-O-methyltransferase [Candidatus Bathyarchaeota archaeon]|nr:fibrillarin-like rRNA/tRNA 2'-O-methyltransferase [Candidatus Bathyarchaeota archaeon]
MREPEVREHERFRNIFTVTVNGLQRLATRNLSPGISFYGEELIMHVGSEYRIWNPYRSKLAAAIVNGVTMVPVRPGSKILYLGAASGTTVSHVSDIVGGSGEVYAVEFSHRSIRELIERVCRHRMNVQPILADARTPSKYKMIVGRVDAIYCDVAQPEQAKLLALNSIFLKKGGEVMIAVKSRSIDVTLSPSTVFEREVETMRMSGFQVFDVVHLEPYEIDHVMITARLEG